MLLPNPHVQKRVSAGSQTFQGEGVGCSKELWKLCKQKAFVAHVPNDLLVDSWVMAEDLAKTYVADVMSTSCQTLSACPNPKMQK